MTFVMFTFWLSHISPSEPSPPAESPLKVWTGTEWAPAGIKVED